MTTKELVPQLDVILAAKRQYLLERKTKTPIEAVRALASMQKRPQPVLSMVTDSSRVMLIGQIKYALPQTGLIGDSYDPVAGALRYDRAEVDAVALFTDEGLYQRGLDDLVLVARAINLPVISQDYILDEYQVVEARAAGASAVILHSTVVEPPTLRALVSATHRNRMTAIVQITNQDELDYALSISPSVIGIRSREANTQQLDIDNARRLRAQIPSHIRVMFTDGLRSLDEVTAVTGLGLHAAIVRESVIESDEDLRRVNTLFNRRQADHPL